MSSTLESKVLMMRPDEFNRFEITKDVLGERASPGEPELGQDIRFQRLFRLLSSHYPEGRLDDIVKGNYSVLGCIVGFRHLGNAVPPNRGIGNRYRTLIRSASEKVRKILMSESATFEDKVCAINDYVEIEVSYSAVLLQFLVYRIVGAYDCIAECAKSTAFSSVIVEDQARISQHAGDVYSASMAGFIFECLGASEDEIHLASKSRFVLGTDFMPIGSARRTELARWDRPSHAQSEFVNESTKFAASSTTPSVRASPGVGFATPTQRHSDLDKVSQRLFTHTGRTTGASGAPVNSPATGTASLDDVKLYTTRPTYIGFSEADNARLDDYLDYPSFAHIITEVINRVGFNGVDLLKNPRAMFQRLSSLMRPDPLCRTANAIDRFFSLVPLAEEPCSRFILRIKRLSEELSEVVPEFRQLSDQFLCGWLQSTLRRVNHPGLQYLDAVRQHFRIADGNSMLQLVEFNHLCDLLILEEQHATDANVITRDDKSGVSESSVLGVNDGSSSSSDLTAIGRTRTRSVGGTTGNKSSSSSKAGGQKKQSSSGLCSNCGLKSNRHGDECPYDSGDRPCHRCLNLGHKSPFCPAPAARLSLCDGDDTISKNVVAAVVSAPDADTDPGDTGPGVRINSILPPPEPPPVYDIRGRRITPDPPPGYAVDGRPILSRHTHTF